RVVRRANALAVPNILHAHAGKATCFVLGKAHGKQELAWNLHARSRAGSPPFQADFTGGFMFKSSVVAASLLTVSGMAGAQTKWDMPTAYPGSNFHTEIITQFAKDIEQATDGKLVITVHPNASLYKAPEIKRAVQGGQAEIGEILLANYQNEWQPFGVDGI